MIYVNLLPPDLRPIKRTPLPYLVVTALIIGAIFFLASTWMRLYAEVSNYDKLIAEADAELAELQVVVDEYNALSRQKLSLQDKVSVIEEILDDRKIWSKHLQRIAELTPDNYWYDRIQVVSKTKTERSQKMNKETGEVELDKDGKPQYETIRVKRPVFEVSGYVIKDDQGEDKVYQLTETTTNDPEFTAHFKLDRASLEDTEFEGYQVRGFTLEYIILQGGES